MNESTVVLAALLLTLGLLPAAAQDAAKSSDASAPAVQPASPAPASTSAAPAPVVKASVKTSSKAKTKALAAPRKNGSILDYQKEIGLKDDQMAQIKTVVNGLQDKFIGQKKAAEQANAEIHKLMQDNGDVKDIRAKLQVLANLEVDRQIDDIEASRAVAKIMTPEQQEKWHNVQMSLNAQARGQSSRTP